MFAVVLTWMVRPIFQELRNDSAFEDASFGAVLCTLITPADDSAEIIIPFESMSL
jgi:hypothetical protein